MIVRLSDDLKARFGRANLFQMRAFYLAYREILQIASGESTSTGALQKVQTASRQSPEHEGLAALAGRLPLPWSHYVRLLCMRNVETRRFYEAEALRGGWTIRQLDRQIGTQFYERTALSRNKTAMLRRGEETKPGDIVTPEEEIKEPYFLEFLDLINLRFPTTGGLYAWEFERHGRELNVRVDGPFVFSDEPLALSAAIEGHGLAMIMEDSAKNALSSGDLVRLLDEWCQPFQGYHLYYPDRRHPSLAFTALLNELRYSPESISTGSRSQRAQARRR